jgi:NADH:ubiquinone oxidoreductase subunit F (NADH-binding)
MTSTLQRPAVATWAIGAPRLLAGLDAHPVLDLRTHLVTHGPLPATDLRLLLGLLDAASIAGRGGAGFDLATKIRGLREGRDLIVNGAESEPGSLKDRVLLQRSPHLVLDGALAVAGAVGANRVTVAVHDQPTMAAVRAALGQRADGKRVRVHLIEGGFVAGEGRAVLRAVRGGPALPPGRKVHPTDLGALISNVETFAQVAVLLRLGAAGFGATGTRREPGTTLLSVGGAVARPGVVEVPLGTPLGIVLAAAGAGPAQAVVIGGYHGSWHTARPEIQLSRAGLAHAGGSFGAGMVMVLGEQTCALGELARVARWLADESAQQCGPCRFGLPALADDVARLARGSREGTEAAAGHARAVTGRGACAHPDGAARFVLSGLHLLQDEADRHRHGGCGRPVLGQLPLGGQS